MKISSFILDNMEAILQDWEDFAKSIQPKYGNMSVLALRDDTKQVMEEIADELEIWQSTNEQTEKSKGLSLEPTTTTAARHGLERLEAGFGIVEMISEYRALRATVIRLWDEIVPEQHINFFDLIRFNEAIDQRVHEAIVSFTAEAEMQTRRFDTVLSFSPDHNYILDREGKFLYANSALLKTLHLSRNELLGKSHFDLNFSAAPDLHKSIKKLIQTATRVKGEVNYCLLSGEVRCFEYVYTPVLDDDREVNAVACTDRDITDRKQAEEEKAKLESVKRQLQKTESLGRMAGAVAHHFNNKLHVVMGYLELAINGPPTDTSINNNLTAARHAAAQAAEVSKMMLTYLGQVIGKREPQFLSEICRRSLPLIKVNVSKNMVLATDLEFPGPVINANATEIQQILTNLVTNAWEASGNDQGAVHLTVKSASFPDISASNRFPINWQPEDSHYACLVVRDNGCGIVEKDLEEVFSPFFSTKFTGRGLGLSVVLGLVQAHGGVVTVESLPGQGSVFRVFFPITAEGIVQQPHKETDAEEIQESGTMLLVDDDTIVLQITGVMLSRLGFTVLTAKDGIEAVEVFQQHRDEICLVVTDVSMPRMNGWETLLALRKIMPGIPVILASGYSEEQVMEGAHTERPQAFLGKPYGFQVLKDTISRTLRETRE